MVMDNIKECVGVTIDNHDVAVDLMFDSVPKLQVAACANSPLDELVTAEQHMNINSKHRLYRKI